MGLVSTDSLDSPSALSEPNVIFVSAYFRFPRFGLRFLTPCVVNYQPRLPNFHTNSQSPPFEQQILCNSITDFSQQSL